MAMTMMTAITGNNIISDIHVTCSKLMPGQDYDFSNEKLRHGVLIDL